MLQEAIYKFKASGPMLLPELIDNYWIGEIKAYEDYAILPYEVHIPQPIDKVIDTWLFSLPISRYSMLYGSG